LSSPQTSLFTAGSKGWIQKDGWATNYNNRLSPPPPPPPPPPKEKLNHEAETDTGIYKNMVNVRSIMYLEYLLNLQAVLYVGGGMGVPHILLQNLRKKAELQTNIQF
jgi:hypothetical protein